MEDYIRHHYAETLTIEKLARIAGVSTRTLFSGFRDFRQLTPMAYLKAIRLEKAHEALQSSDVDGSAGVTKVAPDTGFSHLGRFAQQYRSRFGELPSATARMKGRGLKRNRNRHSGCREGQVRNPKSQVKAEFAASQLKQDLHRQGYNSGLATSSRPGMT